MKDFFEKFEDLIRRVFAPSLTLVAAYALVHLLAAALFCVPESLGDTLDSFGSWVKTHVLGVEATGALVFLAVLVLIGLSFIVSTLNEILHDNFLKKNFNAAPAWVAKEQNKHLEQLREKVIVKLKNKIPSFEDFLPGSATDYLLYEIVGGIDPTSTKNFVHLAKATGIVFISLNLSILGFVIFNAGHLSCWALLLIFLVIPLYWLGLQSVKGHYRARAIRLYVNLSMMPDKRMEKLLMGER